MKELTILIPTYNRPAALTSLLTSLCFQSYTQFDIVISDQSTDSDEISSAIEPVCRVLYTRGIRVQLVRHLPRQGIAEQRQFLLSKCMTPYCLFLDDDLILESFVIKNLLDTVKIHACGFVGMAVIGLSYINDVRPHEQIIEFWREKVAPERVIPGSKNWRRFVLHNAANIIHLQETLHLTPDNPQSYHVSWVGGCVLYDTKKLNDSGGFSFWKKVPVNHCGEDVLAQLRVMRRFGGCGILPSGVYHQELPTTLPDRSYNIPEQSNFIEI